MSVSVDTEKCTGCGLCVSVCPAQAISIIQNKAFIDQNKCAECLRCMDECPTNAIHQIAEKEVYLTQKEPSIPSSLDRTVPPSRQTLPSHEWKLQGGEKGGFFLNEVKKTMDNFFRVDSSFGKSRKGARIKHRRQRKRNGGRRF